MKKLLTWILKPILELVGQKIEETKDAMVLMASEIHANREAIEIFYQAEAAATLRDKGVPQAVIGALMVYEAVSFAAFKFDRDGQAQKILDRQDEILAWTARYANEHGWAIPEKKICLRMLAEWDLIHGAKVEK
jgi:hypothetical protein